MDVTKTRELELCVSCEICMAVCPTDAIAMDNKFGQFLPYVSSEKCTDCGNCLHVCPGIDVDPSNLRHKDVSNDMFNGPCLESYITYSNNPEIRDNSASGGVITHLILELINSNEYDAAFVLPFDKFNNIPARLKASNQVDEIINSAKSKYIPASVYNVIIALKERAPKKYIIVGIPCQFSGIKKYLVRNNISDHNLIFLGLFCEKTLNFNMIRYYEDSYKKTNENLVQFRFKTKERYGWPGNSKATFDSGREVFIDRRERLQLKRYFQLNRCLYCLDKLNRMADISCGDCYIKGEEDPHGVSNVIIRTPKGKDIFGEYSYSFTLRKERAEEIRKSQGLIDKKDNLEYAKFLIKTNSIYPDEVSDYEINDEVPNRLLKLQKHISWGKNYNRNKIRCNLLMLKIVGKAKVIGKAILAGISLGECFLVSSFMRSNYAPKNKKKRNIIIVGGSLFNKGSQAMVFTVVDQMKRRFPNKDIYLFSTADYHREDKDKSIYAFGILPWGLTTQVRLSGFLGKLFFKKVEYLGIDNDLRHTITNADCIIDVSGYALSSQFSFSRSLDYLLNILIAKKHSIPYYIFPQSIGPFEYPLKSKILLYPLMKLCLTYPEKIYPREEEGISYLHKFTKKNVEQYPDIVLQNNGYNLVHIYNNNMHFEDVEIEADSVGIVPNFRVIERVDANKLYAIYATLISTLVNANKKVYILRHSHEDLGVCRHILSFSPDDKKIKLIPHDLNAVQLENVLQSFDFVIASRYHSIVHSYRNGVPALVIGWATKYYELLKYFHQLDYFFDCRSNIDINEINNSLEKLLQGYEREREVVINRMTGIREKNVFRIFDKDVEVVS